MNTRSYEGNASVKPVAAFLDVHAPEVRAAIQAEAPQEIDLRIATSGDPEELHNLAADAEFFIGGVAPIPASLINAAPKLRLIHKWGVGYNTIDLNALRERGIPLAITAGANAVPVAEFTILLMLSVLRRLPHHLDQLHAGDWKKTRAETRLHSLQLRGKRVAIVGMGNIGREVAKRLRPFEVEVSYFDVRRISSEQEQDLGVSYQPLDDLLVDADIVTLHVPLVEATRNLLSRERIGRLKPGAIVVNTARGELIDQDALVEALVSGHLRGAGLDVFRVEPPPADDPLLALNVPGLVLAPHMGGSVYDNVPNVSRHIFRNILRILNGDPIPERDLVKL